MRLMLLVLLQLFLILPAFSQEEKEETVYFSDAIKEHLNKYNTQSDIEYEKGDLVKGQALFDSLVQNYLVGSKFTDYSFKSINSGKVKLSKIKKPVLIITYASWCVINKGEIPALNNLSKKYSKQVEIIVLFWDKKSEAKKIGSKFGGKITVCYANESYRNDAKIVATLKHTLGLPTCYFLNSHLEVIDIKRGSIPIDPKTPYREAIAKNYALFDGRMGEWLTKNDAMLAKEQLAAED